jgi:hypothetical protein
MKVPTDDEKLQRRVVKLARAEYEVEGEIEIDDAAEISYSETCSGAYVQAWIWVENPDKCVCGEGKPFGVKKCSSCRALEAEAAPIEE